MVADQLSECVIADVASSIKNALVGGPFGSDLVSKDYVPEGVPVIRGTNMGQGRWVGGEFAYVTPEKADSLSANCAKPGDLVFTQRGTLGQVALVPQNGSERYLISQSQMKLTVDANKVDAMFLYYVFNSSEQQDYIRQNAIQAGVPHTNLGILRKTPLKIPPLLEQKQIAHILGTLDDKIELNRRMNVTMEAMARALFQSWFVDFDPTRRNAEGSVSRPEDCLFPNSSEDSELGKIPIGWEVGKLDQIAGVKMGLSPSGDSYNSVGDGIPLINGPVEFGEYFPVKTKWSDAATRFATKDDLIFCVRGSTTGKRVISDGEYAIGRGVCAISANDGFYSFLYQTINFGLERMLSKTTGSVFPSLSAPDIKSFKVVKPPNFVIEAFERFTKPLLEQIQNNCKESSTLATLRDTASAEAAKQ